MSKQRNLPQIVPTRETNRALENPDCSGECHPMNTGRHGVFIEVPEHIYALIGVEGGALVDGRRVTVLWPHPGTNRVVVQRDDGFRIFVKPGNITPAPKTRTVTLEVEASVDPRHLSLIKRGKEPYSGEEIPYRIVAIDGEEADDE